jgi:WD40 repeat protein
MCVCGRVLRRSRGATAWALSALLGLLCGAGQTARAQVVPPKATLGSHPGPVTVLALSPDGKLLASGNGARAKDNELVAVKVRLWEMPSGKALATLDGPPEGVYSLAFSPDGKALAVGAVAVGGDEEGGVTTWEVATQKRLHSLPAHAQGPVAVAFSPDGRRLASAGGMGGVKLWDPRTGKLTATLPDNPPSSSPAVAFSPDGKVLATGGDDVRLWPMPGGRNAMFLEGRREPDATAASLVFIPNGRTLAACNAVGAIQLWEARTGKVRASLQGHSRVGRALAVPAEGNALASLDLAGEVLLWDLATGKECASVGSVLNPGFTAVAFTPDGMTLVTGGSDGAVRLWDVGRLRRHHEQVQSWTRSPPGVTPREAAEMRKRIAALSSVTSLDFDPPPPLAGPQPPLPSTAAKMRSLLLEDHRGKPAAAFLELVRLGPRAVPFLLQALDDRTPTRLLVRWEANPRKILYRASVGDVCYAALGHIVGEPYTLTDPEITLVGPPSQDRGLVRRVRMTWASDDPAGLLYRSLLKQYRTRPPDDDWVVEGEQQIEAVMRLLYYFPARSAPLLAAHLSRLDVAALGEDSEARNKRDATNGVRTAELIEAVAWCKEPALRKALRGVFERTTDAEILLAALPGVEGLPEKQIRARLEALLDRLPEAEELARGSGHDLLVALGKRAGKDARPAFLRYLRKASLQRKWTMCRVLRETNGEWAVELLGPLLTDKRIGLGGPLARKPGRSNPQRLRLCDDAAVTISAHNPELRFTLTEQHADRDRQIDRMRKQIARRKR